MLFIVPQSGTEQVLAARADELGVEVVRGAEVVGLTQDDDGVTVECADGDTVAPNYVVGCDGAHSTVRRLARHRLRRQAVRDAHPARRRAPDAARRTRR